MGLALVSWLFLGQATTSLLGLLRTIFEPSSAEKSSHDIRFRFRRRSDLEATKLRLRDGVVRVALFMHIVTALRFTETMVRMFIISSSIPEE